MCLALQPQAAQAAGLREALAEREAHLTKLRGELEAALREETADLDPARLRCLRIFEVQHFRFRLRSRSLALGWYLPRPARHTHVGCGKPLVTTGVWLNRSPSSPTDPAPVAPGTCVSGNSRIAVRVRDIGGVLWEDHLAHASGVHALQGGAGAGSRAGVKFGTVRGGAARGQPGARRGARLGHGRARAQGGAGLCAWLAPALVLPCLLPAGQQEITFMGA